MAAISTLPGITGSRLMPNPAAESGPVQRDTMSQAPPTREPVPAGGGELDAAAVADVASRLQETIDKVSLEPHFVGFRHDPRIQGFVIEIRDRDGTLVNQIPPEKLLNLRQKLAELSGMVVDATT